MSRILIVSNRLPITVEATHGEVTVSRSVGGLATGLKGLHESSEGLWIGWPGDVSGFDAAQKAEVERRLSELRTAPVHLSPSEVSRYYDGFANAVLWPLFHYLLDRIPAHTRGWDAYTRVNRRFADLVVDRYREGDIIWVHDYQLMLVPAMVRERLPAARIGFFLHIPFPSSEIFRILPWREAILEGLLGADLIGFHTWPYLNHFTSSVLRVLGIDCNVDRLVYAGREVHLGVFPMGVDAPALSRESERPEVLAQTAAIRDSRRNVSILLGIDRLDYTKGIPRRFLAVERLLDREPSLRGRVQLVQVAVPSRVKVEAYTGFRKLVDEEVGRINGAYTTVTTPAIHYLHRSFSERNVLAMYRAADVMLVTPVRDGMNLVAKEFVAARNDEDGVLVLSEFAGAAAELTEAIIVNPYDIDGVARGIDAALKMNPEERRARMKKLRERVFANDVRRWADDFVDRLERIAPPRGNRPHSIAPQAAIEGALDRICRASELVLLLDYDGTLVPFASTPDLAAPDRELLDLLELLAKRPHTSVNIVSGRSEAALERWLGHLPIALYAEHGSFYKPRSAGKWTALREGSVEWKSRLRPILQDFAKRTPGALVEEKATSLAWHYRAADAELGRLRARELRAHLATALQTAGIHLLLGDRVIEVRVQGVHKGLAVARVLTETEPSALIVAAGDDTTDEDMFAALPSEAVSIHVGPAESRAALRLADPQSLRRMLRAIANRV